MSNICLPEVSIGLVGHVDHGKTTLTEKLSGVWTDRHSEELKRGITIRLGYADCTFYKCPKCHAYMTLNKCMKCLCDTKYVRTISFVDAPGHETLMATMLSGAAIMDGALLVIGANEPCPQPQTKEHLMALDIIGIKNLIIVQNKVDLITEEQAKENYKQIKEFVKGTVAENAPIIPVSAQLGININILISAIEELIPTPKKNPNDPPLMFIARSFDINKPGSNIEKLHGAVLGGSLADGKLSVGDVVEICPPVGGTVLKTKITKMNHGGTSVDSICTGGTFGVETELDPALSKSDRLSGKVLGLPGKLPPVRDSLDLEVHLLERVVGSQEELVVEPVRNGEALMLNAGTATTLGTVKSANKKGQCSMSLKLPVCAQEDSRITIARRFGTRWRLIGYGVVQ